MKAVAVAMVEANDQAYFIVFEQFNFLPLKLKNSMMENVLLF